METPTAMGIPILNALWTVEGRINSGKSSPITGRKIGAGVSKLGNRQERHPGYQT
jgi:hypothetical protein